MDDPVAMPEAKRIFNGVQGLSFAETPSQALNNVDALVIVTEWKEFRSQNFSIIKQNLKPILFLMAAICTTHRW